MVLQNELQSKKMVVKYLLSILKFSVIKNIKFKWNQKKDN